MRCWTCTAASRSDMVFSSITFLFAFLPATLLGYYVLPRRWRLVFLLLASLVFYAWGEPVYVLLMMGAILVNWVIGLLMARFPRRKKLLLVLAVALDLSMLGVFKYASFLLDTAAALVPALAGRRGRTSACRSASRSSRSRSCPMSWTSIAAMRPRSAISCALARM